MDRLFYPKSVAVVGASPNGGGGKLPFYQALLAAGYEGKLYPVNPKHDEINGAKVYKSLADVPDEIDLVIALVPARHAQEIFEIAVNKKMGFVHYFTSGFAEAGNKEREEALLKTAEKGNTRIVGPNCMGVHCASSKVTFDPSIKQEGPGDIAFLGQSGGVTNNVMRISQSRRLMLNKVVSYGNQIDLRAEDYMEYFAKDDDIKVIGAYIEDIKDTKTFLKVISNIASKKPVVILKGGSTRAGSRAAMSHTGAMAGDNKIWAAAMRQVNCIEVETQEELVNAMMMASSRKLPSGARIGFMGGGGGTSVLFTDLAEKDGLEIPVLSDKTRETISEKIPDVNTSTVNPVDLGAYGFNFDVLAHTMKALDDDENIDVIVAFFALDFFTIFSKDFLDEGMKLVAKTAAGLDKPVVIISSKPAEDNVSLEELRVKTLDIFRPKGIPVYLTLQEATKSISKTLDWKLKTS